VGISVTVGADSSVYKHCYGIAGGENIWNCVESTVTGKTGTFGVSAQFFIGMGEESIPTAIITDKIVDPRVYPNSDSAVLPAQFIQRHLYCPENCLTCLSPFECATYPSGFYLSDSQCTRCSECSGPSNTACSVCNSGCELIAPSTCVRCGEGCFSCLPTGECLVCMQDYYLEVYTHTCVTKCPTGI